MKNQPPSGGCVLRSWHGKQNTPTHLGRLRLFYPSGNEGGAGVLRCHHAVGSARGVGGGALETGDPLGDRPHLCIEADPF